MNLKSKDIFILTFVILVSTAMATQINTIYPVNVTASQNTSNLSIAIYLDNDKPLAGLQFQLNYPSILIYKSIQTTSRSSNATIEVNSLNATSLSLAAVIQENISAGNGAIFNAIFDVNETAAAGDYPLNMSQLLISNISAQPLSISDQAGLLRIIADDDSDGIENAVDACPSVAGCTQFSGCGFGLIEWLPPITTQTPFDMEADATLPFKFNVTTCSGSFYSDSGVTVRVLNTTLGIDKFYNASGTGDEYIRINSTEQLYIVNIHTNQLDMPIGNYSISTKISNAYNRTIGFGLVNKIGNGKGVGRVSQN